MAIDLQMSRTAKSRTGQFRPCPTTSVGRIGPDLNLLVNVKYLIVLPTLVVIGLSLIAPKQVDIFRERPSHGAYGPIGAGRSPVGAPNTAKVSFGAVRYDKKPLMPLPVADSSSLRVSSNARRCLPRGLRRSWTLRRTRRF